MIGFKKQRRVHREVSSESSGLDDYSMMRNMSGGSMVEHSKRECREKREESRHLKKEIEI